MSYTLGTAAKATGKSKTTILRAIRSGKISAEKVVDGSWRIEPSEVHRVYPEVPPVTVSDTHDDAIRDPVEHLETLLAQERLAAADDTIKRLEDQVSDLKARENDLRGERDAWRDQAQRKRLTWRGLFGGKEAE